MTTYIYYACYYVGRGRLKESDNGYVAIVQTIDGEEHLASPSLPASDLEQFCKSHIERYDQFYTENCLTRADKGSPIPIRKFW